MTDHHMKHLKGNRGKGIPGPTGWQSKWTAEYRERAIQLFEEEGSIRSLHRRLTAEAEEGAEVPSTNTLSRWCRGIAKGGYPVRLKREAIQLYFEVGTVAGAHRALVDRCEKRIERVPSSEQVRRWARSEEGRAQLARMERAAEEEAEFEVRKHTRDNMARGLRLAGIATAAVGHQLQQSMKPQLKPNGQVNMEALVNPELLLAATKTLGEVWDRVMPQRAPVEHHHSGQVDLIGVLAHMVTPPAIAVQESADPIIDLGALEANDIGLAGGGDPYKMLPKPRRGPAPATANGPAPGR